MNRSEPIYSVCKVIGEEKLHIVWWWLGVEIVLPLAMLGVTTTYAFIEGIPNIHLVIAGEGHLLLFSAMLMLVMLIEFFEVNYISASTLRIFPVSVAILGILLLVFYGHNTSSILFHEHVVKDSPATMHQLREKWSVAGLFGLFSAVVFALAAKFRIIRFLTSVQAQGARA